MRYYFDAKTKSLRRYDDQGLAERWDRKRLAWTRDCASETACKLTKDIPISESAAETFCDWTRRFFPLASNLPTLQPSEMGV